MCDVLLLFNNKFLGGAWLLAKFVLPENETKRNFVFLFLFTHIQNKVLYVVHAITVNWKEKLNSIKHRYFDQNPYFKTTLLPQVF